MGREREQFISGEDEELKRLRSNELENLKVQRARKQEMNAKLVHVNDSDFNETVIKHPLVLIDFWAEWCGPCRALAPTIEELANEYAGKILVGKLNVDENPVTAERFQVFSIPTVLIMKNAKEVDRIVGCVPKDQIETSLKKYLG